MNKDCSLVISSCDSYSDAWEPFFILFFRYWTDCPFGIYLISETKKFEHPRVHTINLATDNGWAGNLKIVLNQINTPFIIYFQEDYLLKSLVDTKYLLKLVEVLKNNIEVAYLRLYPAPAPRDIWSKDKSLGLIRKFDAYYASLQAAIWDKNFLHDLLIPSEMGWVFEMEGSKRASESSRIFLGVRKRKPAIDYYCTAIKKGVWFRDAVALIKHEGLDFKSTRKVESLTDYLLRVSKLKWFTNRVKWFFRGTFIQNK